MRRNSQSNRLIQWLVMAGDFVLLNVIVMAFSHWHWRMGSWLDGRIEIFILVNNIALILSEQRFSTIVHLRVVGAGDILRRIIGLTTMQAVTSYLLLKVVDYDLPIGLLQWEIGTAFVLCLMVKRYMERWMVKLYREAGRNSRAVTLVGTDPELVEVYHKLRNDLSLGYNILGYYGSAEQKMEMDADRNGSSKKRNKRRRVPEIDHLGTIEDFMKGLDDPDSLVLGDELYLCVSRQYSNLVKSTSRMCDHKVIRFFYVPISVESLGLNLKREQLDDMEVFTTYENPLQNSLNRFKKRTFDIVLSLVFLIPTILIFPFVWLIIKIQSPGPIFFRQKRTGLDGKEFEMLKFRSMHVNADADKLQATKDDPRKYPFGNFMRKSNIDELPQFLNVLKGDMSIVGPRPHMLLHTEQYSQLIDKYMVRHFVKPGLTGWAQVTGFRGETKELWQMEGRVKRDIWYMEHWSIWLDIRIIWLTAKTIFKHDKNAY